MLQALSRHPKLIAWPLAILFYIELVLSPAVANGAVRPESIQSHYSQSELQSWFENRRKQLTPTFVTPGNEIAIALDEPYTGGPSQPEMASFTSVNSANMVDLFTGDFSYNIPLMDVGGYPLSLAYRGGISMDQDASWVGLGWNINPGTITRNLRGLPDDFDGKSDSIRKVMHIRPNETVGVTGGADVEIAGFPQNLQNQPDTVYKGGIGASLGVFKNTYRGWGIEHGLNASINAGQMAKGPLSGGLSFTNNSQEGLNITPSLSLKLKQLEVEEGNIGIFSVSLPYNSRAGLKGLQVSAGVSQYKYDEKNQRYSTGGSFNSVISFVSPAFTPTINIPYTSRQFTFTGKLGYEKKVYHPSFFLSGYVSTQSIAVQDTLLALPAYGYLHLTQGAQNRGALLDFNREKDLPYREKPAVPHIAIPSYTYDAFSITGEGTAGMFRAYRGDIGFVHDHFMRTRDESDRVSVDVGVGDLTHGGVDLNVNRAVTQTGPWLASNPLKRVIDFREDSVTFESVFFRNPGEKSINSKTFYERLGGDDVVAVQLYQSNRRDPYIQTTNYLTTYKNKRATGSILLTPDSTIKPERDKRTQVITYISAKEADAGAALTKYIENYTTNQFSPVICGDAIFGNVEGQGVGLPALYFPFLNFDGVPYSRLDPRVSFKLEGIGQKWDIPKYPPYNQDFPTNKFSIRWEGRILAPVTGQYIFYLRSDDGVRLWLNDSLRVNEWRDQPMDRQPEIRDTVNLVAGELYKIKIDYYENKERAGIELDWSYKGQPRIRIPHSVLYPPPATDTFKINNYLVKEKRINKFRKENHISEIHVLNSDGRRYVYGIPVYNLKQKETTFSVEKTKGDPINGLVHYNHGTDNTANNRLGRDWYYNSEEIPAYAHSFLLTGILSTDYSDVTGNGISDDDIGDAIKFNYTKICGIANPYKWRAPQDSSAATYNEGLKTDYRDDKGNYVYGEKELWYLHSMQSKTMIATFVLESRADLPAINEQGNKIHDGSVKRLKEINLYTKAEFMKKGTAAKPIKTVHFRYSYTLCPGVDGEGSAKLTLDSLWFTYNGNNKGRQNPYVFHYSSKNPEYNIKSYDRWGNFKDPLQNPGSTVGNPITNAEYPYALQDSAIAAQNASAWMLDSIMLPSGGFIKVQYESDDYAYVQNRRAMQMLKIAGLGASSSANAVNRLYRKVNNDNFEDNLYVFIKVPSPVSSAKDVYNKYLQGVSKLYFRLFVKMPDDQFGTGREYVACYANLSSVDAYGVVNGNTIWVKIEGVSMQGDKPGSFSPLAKAAIQFLRLNLPSKAYPGSENAGSLDAREAVQALASLGDNIKNMFRSYDGIARNRLWAVEIDTSRSFVRLNNPVYKKYGGGHRVKRIVIYDNWDKMTGQRAATYGQEYIYTERKNINGDTIIISSGVAGYEPMLGGEENPFRLPVEYVESVSPLGPVTLGYSEEPLGESFYPAAGVGYSCVRMRTIHYKNKKSANGYEETKFYTAYDFPVYTDRTMIDDNTKKRFRPAISNFLRINARHYLSVSQGFKVELNDMHGKLRSKATYPETDPNNYITYSENIYRVENSLAEFKRLSNTVMAIRPDGTIDSAALIGKDVELMVDMREQASVTNGNNVSLNTDMFSVPFTPPFFLIPSFINLAQREENVYRSVATAKIIQRYGILDSVIAIDKGSKVSTKDILYDAETGDVLLTRTQNEFNDYVYNFTYPSHWAYDGMGLAYKNINLVLRNVNIRDGKIVTSLPAADSLLFSSGDEILVAGKMKTADAAACVDSFSTFPHYNKIWAVDSSVLNGGPKSFYFIDRDGRPYGGYDVTLKIIRSGRRNIFGAVGSVSMLESPIWRNSETGNYELKIDSLSKAVAAGAASFKQFWKTEDIKRIKTDTVCASFAPLPCEGDTSCTCTCLRKLFDYLIAHRRLFIKPTQNITVDSIARAANNAGYSLNTSDCDLLSKNATKPFYSITQDSISHIYKAKIGNCIVSILSDDTTAVNFYQSLSMPCDSSENVRYTYIRRGENSDTVITTFKVTESLTGYTISDNEDGILPGSGPFYTVDSSTQRIVAAVKAAVKDFSYSVSTLVRFGGINLTSIPPSAVILSASLTLYAHPGSFAFPTYPFAHKIGVISDAYRIATPQFDWNHSTTWSDYNSGYSSYPEYTYDITSVNQNLTVDMKEFVEDWLYGTNGNRGIEFTTNISSSTAHYNTYCSQRYVDTTKHPILTITYSEAQLMDTVDLTLLVESCDSCSLIVDNSCRSLVVDTAFNPYVVGVLGNWRADKSLVYYSRRTESDPTTATTDIRRFGTIQNFAPYWKFANGELEMQNDTTRWVWNSETTLFNRKGFEIENRDPLGRYNSVLYGYNLTLPIVVTQNSRNRESAYEGFEDYDFVTQVCDTACSATRHMDFTAYKANIDTSQKHTGKASLRIAASTQAALSIPVSSEAADSAELTLDFNFNADTCAPDDKVLASIQTDNKIVLPSFNPIPGKRMVLSAWVKEEQDCKCISYTNNRIVVAFPGTELPAFSFAPTGRIIEGWQRYESYFDIPEEVTSIAVSLEATGSVTVYFDDLRLHPFNANMKSFVFHPINLRMMAELDENNYATYYEYDDDGTLIRLKKETERGIKLIRETRSALLKQ